MKPAIEQTAFHGGRMTINLRALQANWCMLAKRAMPAETAAAVKADAYGLGIDAVVPALLEVGCKTFFVAHMSEALRVRALSRQARIYVLNGLPLGATQAYLEAHLCPVLGSLAEIEEWRNSAPADAPSALHVDTGLNRLGLSAHEIRQVPTPYQPDLLLSHFVASEAPDDPINDQQIKAFNAARALIQSKASSLCNSSALFLNATNEIVFDLVRPGYALYGGNPTPNQPNPMHEVVRLEARIMQLREVQAGDSIGYNHQWTAERACLIATLSLGYADGYHRAGAGVARASGGVGILHGVHCPIVGRISMDLITLDVSAAPDPKRGDWVSMLGGGLALDDVAKRLNTNGYEVLTSLGRRHERVYIKSQN